MIVYPGDAVLHAPSGTLFEVLGEDKDRVYVGFPGDQELSGAQVYLHSTFHNLLAREIYVRVEGIRGVL